MKENQCKRCPHKWYQRTPQEPKVCPKCKSPYWNTERKEKSKALRKQLNEIKQSEVKIKKNCASCAKEINFTEDKYKKKGRYCDDCNARIGNEVPIKVQHAHTVSDQMLQSLRLWKKTDPFFTINRASRELGYTESFIMSVLCK